MDQRDKMLEVARAQVGYKEGAGNATKYGAWYGLDHQPWCAMFVAWCAAQAGIPEGTIPKLAYVPYMVAFYSGKGLLRGKDYTPQPGDIVFYGRSSHVGIVSEARDGRIYAIEGNTSRDGNSSNGDGVYLRERALSDPWIMGYATPAYEEGDDMEIKDITIELQAGDGLTVAAQVTVPGVNIKGYNYVQLRALPELISGVVVRYDEERGLPVVVLPVTEEGLLHPTKVDAAAALITLANALGL